MTYIVEKKRTGTFAMLKHKMYIRYVYSDFCIRADMSEATHFSKQALRKVYKKYGRENVIVHKVN